jgi:hypothetical protein
MTEKTPHSDDEQGLKDAGDHVLHGVEDVADVLGHGIGGAVKGLADGVESASAQTEVRKDDAG